MACPGRVGSNSCYDSVISREMTDGSTPAEPEYPAQPRRCAGRQAAQQHGHVHDLLHDGGSVQGISRHPDRQAIEMALGVQAEDQPILEGCTGRDVVFGVWSARSSLAVRQRAGGGDMARFMVLYRSPFSAEDQMANADPAQALLEACRSKGFVSLATRR
jgi:hypothetical protein